MSLKLVCKEKLSVNGKTSVTGRRIHCIYLTQSYIEASNPSFQPKTPTHALSTKKKANEWLKNYLIEMGQAGKVFLSNYI